MWTIAKHESLSLLKSIKSILVLIILLGSTYAGIWIAREAKSFFDILPEDETKVFAVGLSFAILIFGPLFALILSHDAFNREIEQRTMRFLVTKVKRTDIVFGKVLGHSFFWLVMLVVANGMIFLFSSSLSFQDFFETLSFCLTYVAFALLLSMLIRKTIFSAFVGIFLGITIPVLSLWAMFSEKWYISFFKYLTPYYYVTKESMYFLVNFAFVALLIALVIVIFKRRDF